MRYSISIKKLLIAILLMGFGVFLFSQTNRVAHPVLVSEKRFLFLILSFGFVITGLIVGAMGFNKSRRR
jgi:hypothetical protein